MSKKQLTILILITLMFVISGCHNKPECGNSEIEIGEDSTTCCKDAGCEGERTCIDNKCENPKCGEDEYLNANKGICVPYPECGTCEYLDKDAKSCKSYDCCKNDDCSKTQECIEHECKKVTCDDCSYIEEHKCKPLNCCKDSDCDDNDDETIDLCKYPSTQQSECTHESINECETASDCDDNKKSTNDKCTVGVPRTCINVEIKDCIDNDDYCPEDYCNYKNDNDCEKVELDCNDLTCFYDALDDCLVAKHTLEAYNETNDIRMDVNTLIRVIEEDDDVCEVYFKTQQISLEYTDDYKDDLADPPHNYTSNQIDDLEEDAQDDAEEVEGDKWTCFFDDTDDLIEILNDWEDGNYEVMDLESYDCEGDNWD